MFNYYARLIRMREKHAVVAFGRYDLIAEGDPALYAFTRTLHDARLLVVANFFGGTTAFTLPDAIAFASAEVMIANYPVEAGEDTRALSLQPYEARVYRPVG